MSIPLNPGRNRVDQEYDPQQDFALMPKPDQWQARVDRLRQDVALLRKAGVKVVVVTGSRNWVAEDLVMHALHRILEPPHLRAPRQFLVVHGAARGLDRIAGRIALDMGMNVLDLPAPWEQYGKGAGAIRNQAMIDLRPDLVLGFLLGESRGTRDCLRRAGQAKLQVYVVEG